MDDVQTVEVRQARPEQAPDGWLVFNAPRPIYGHREWIGDFITGVFYVAVDPDAPEATHYIMRNGQLDAKLLHYVTQKEWDERVDAYGQKMVDEHGVDLADFDRSDIEFSYVGWLQNQGQLVRY